MEFKQLEAFVAVVDWWKLFRSKTKKLYLTQPTISAHVRSLEEEPHTKLIIRTTKKTTITTKVTSSTTVLYACWRSSQPSKISLVSRNI